MGYDAKSLSKLIGYRIQIKVEGDGEYEGTLKKVSLESGEIILRRVFTLPGKELLIGPQCFFISDLLSYCIIRGPHKEKSNEASPRIPDEGQPLLKYSKFPSRIVKRPDKIDDAFLPGITLCNEDKEDCNDTFDEIGEEEEKELEKLLRNNKCADCSIIDEITEKFYDSVSHIRTQSVIGVAVEGAPVNRSGVICWVSVATKDHVFLYDVLVLQEKVFSEGLKYILEDPAILKVMHDCRNPSDALYHQYRVKLINVFDTQVADVEIWFEKNKKLPRYVRGLPHCLVNYLSLNDHDVYSPRIRQHCIKDDLAIWRERPLRPFLRNAAVKNVIYLRQLRVAVLESLLAKVNIGIDIYLEAIRNLSDEELETQPSLCHLLPPGFYHTYLKTRRVQHNSQPYIVKYLFKDGKNADPSDDPFGKFNSSNHYIHMNSKSRKNEDESLILSAMNWATGVKFQSKNDELDVPLLRSNAKSQCVKDDVKVTSFKSSMINVEDSGIKREINSYNRIDHSTSHEVVDNPKCNSNENSSINPVERCSSNAEKPTSFWPKVPSNINAKFKLIPG